MKNQVIMENRTKSCDDYTGVIEIERDIIVNDIKIGYVQMFVQEETDEDYGYCYIASIEIIESQRNKGYGTEVLTALADEFNGVYLCPENEDAERLYERIGYETASYPEALQGSVDEYGSMYRID